MKKQNKNRHISYLATGFYLHHDCQHQAPPENKKVSLQRLHVRVLVALGCAEPLERARVCVAGQPCVYEAGQEGDLLGPLQPIAH